MRLSVKLQAFEGPLDLLLHLIDKNKVNIYDIPIVEITEQYLEYVSAMETQDLNVVSEFLVIAATLIDIKSKMLLPRDVNEEEVEDPRQELVEKLLEYKMYKHMSFELKDRQIVANKILYKEPNLPKEILEYEQPINLELLIGDLTLKKLNDIFNEVIKKQIDKVDKVRSKFGEIEKDEVSMGDKIQEILSYANKYKRFSFKKLLLQQYNKMHIIVGFLAVLELIKLGHINIVQDNIFDDIMIIAT